MKERPILMHARSITGILEGRKTQTRRIIKPQPIAGLNGWDWGWPLPKRCTPGSATLWRNDCPPTQRISTAYSPFGVPGDRLWVREAWRARLDQDHIKPRDLKPTSVWYCATGNGHGDEEPSGCGGGLGKKRPGIFMPRWASRLTLEVTEIRVERVQDMDWRDAISEGIVPQMCCNGQHCGCHGEPIEDPTLEFQSHWDDTNGPGAWERNDWVWVVGFKVLKGKS